MPLISSVLETQLNALSKKAEKSPMTSDDYNKELANIITNYIKTATIGTPSGAGTIL